MDTCAQQFDQNRSFLWGLAYRMTGCAADADDVVQETFVRFLERAEDEADRPPRPWLTRVAMNLARDLLRRRRRCPYVGPWLPSPVAGDGDGIEAIEVVASGVSTEGRYDLVESVSMAFLVALEELTPKQRAVLLLRDVFDYPVAETAAVLGCSEGSVKLAHLRARAAMRGYDATRPGSLADARARAGQALWDLTGALVAGDLPRLEGLLAADCRAVSDGGGEFYAALNPVLGAADVARFLLGLVRKYGGIPDARPVVVGGTPALLVRFDGPPPPAAPRVNPARVARRFLLQVDVDDAGRVTRLYSVLASRKLTHVG